MHNAISPDTEFESIQSELLLNLIAIVKLQQLNIELLWEACGTGRAPVHALTEMRESSGHLTDRLEQFYGPLARTEKPAN